MTEPSWAAIKRLVYERAKGCCEYCQSCEDNTSQAMHIEHIDPKSGDSEQNLCLSCASCNLSKAKATSAIDPETGEIVPLFNPRMQLWTEHFTWIDGGIRIAGKTANGRATIERLKMNQKRMLRARQNWIAAKNHPPK